MWLKNMFHMLDFHFKVANTEMNKNETLILNQYTQATSDSFELFWGSES